MSVFQFKHFAINQANCGMKISSTATVLGGITECKTAKTVLDIGTGTGLLALMIAQRNLDAQITAIEYETNAAQQAKDNFVNSPWKDRLQVIEADVLTLPSNFGKYELIICNPPFFHAHLQANDKQRNLARHSQDFTPEALANICHNWLEKEGKCWILIAENYFERYKNAFLNQGLFLFQQYTILDKPDSQKPICYILAFSRNKEILQESVFYLRGNNAPYSPEIQDLLQDFLRIF